uniref:Uncharacterized protein n=1 Tax=Anopheles melas TaxID=34690 RepID=A0A182TJZ8_9DIPT
MADYFLLPVLLTTIHNSRAGIVPAAEWIGLSVLLLLLLSVMQTTVHQTPMHRRTMVARMFVALPSALTAIIVVDGIRVVDGWIGSTRGVIHAGHVLRPVRTCLSQQRAICGTVALLLGRCGSRCARWLRVR